MKTSCKNRVEAISKPRRKFKNYYDPSISLHPMSFEDRIKALALPMRMDYEADYSYHTENPLL